MKYELKVIILFIAFLSLKINAFAQSSTWRENENINKYIKITKITGVEIHDSETGTKWKLSDKGLKTLKSILNKSHVSLSMLLPPSRFYIKFITMQNLEGYETYMNQSFIFFDPGYTSPKQKKHDFAIVLSKDIDWSKLR